MSDGEITANMAEAIAFVHEHGEVVRYVGGYWSYKGVTFTRQKFARGSSRNVPDKYFGESTIAALLKRGKLVAVQVQGVNGGRPVKVQLSDDLKRDMETATMESAQ